MIFNKLAVFVFYCKLQLIQNILTNNLYPPPPPRRSVKFWRQGKKKKWKSCSLSEVCCHFGAQEYGETMKIFKPKRFSILK